MNDFGISPADVMMQQQSDLPGAAPDMASALMVSNSPGMYEYRTSQKLHGIPVQQQARDLLVRNDGQLQQALQLTKRQNIFLQWISPETPDKIQQYRKLLQQASQGSIYIYEQTKQYDPQAKSYLIFIKYAQLSYTMNPRFSFMRPQ